MNNKYIDNDIDITWEAYSIIMRHTEEAIYGLDYEPNDEDEFYQHMVEGCSFILVADLISKKYTPMQYAAIRNELAWQLMNIFNRK